MPRRDSKEVLRWTPVGVLLALAVIAPLFGDSPTAVVVPLLLAMVLAAANITQQKKGKTRS